MAWEDFLEFSLHYCRAQLRNRRAGQRDQRDNLLTYIRRQV